MKLLKERPKKKFENKATIQLILLKQKKFLINNLKNLITLSLNKSLKASIASFLSLKTSLGSGVEFLLVFVSLGVE